MFWFRSKQKRKEADAVKHDATIEIVAHKQARKEVVEQAKVANKQLNDLLVENGFTVKIFLAAGGTHHTKKKGKL